MSKRLTFVGERLANLLKGYSSPIRDTGGSHNEDDLCRELRDFTGKTLRVTLSVSRMSYPQLKFTADALPKELHDSQWQVNLRDAITTLKLNQETFATIAVGDKLLLEGIFFAAVKPCALCRGSGKVKCTVCHGHGWVKGPSKFVATGRNPGGQKLGFMEATKVNCSNCNGTGSVPCSHNVPAKKWSPFSSGKDDTKAAFAELSATHGLYHLYLCLDGMSGVVITASGEKIPVGQQVKLEGVKKAPH